jgi:hypothetical protein
VCSNTGAGRLNADAAHISFTKVFVSITAFLHFYAQQPSEEKLVQRRSAALCACRLLLLLYGRLILTTFLPRFSKGVRTSHVPERSFSPAERLDLAPCEAVVHVFLYHINAQSVL